MTMDQEKINENLRMLAKTFDNYCASSRCQHCLISGALCNVLSDIERYVEYDLDRRDNHGIQ